MEDVFSLGLRKLGYQELREGQRKVISYLDGNDVFVCSPTGSGKSLCFERAPFLFEATYVGVDAAETQSTASSVCLVVAPFSITDERSSLIVEESRYSSGDDRPRM